MPSETEMDPWDAFWLRQLPEFLRYADRNSMAFSREVRLPFLDHRLAEFAFGLPPDLLLKGATTKIVRRESMRGIVPDQILDRKDKLAYAPPQHCPSHACEAREAELTLVYLCILPSGELQLCNGWAALRCMCVGP